MQMQLFHGEKEQLVDFLCTNDWPFHSQQLVQRQAITQAVDSGYYENERETFWIIVEEQKIGLLIINDIEDTIPLIDLRLSTAARGKNIGTEALLWLKDYLFGEKKKIRIEGYTRVDNIAMRKCFTKAGFVKEGYLRQAWENEDGSVTDTIVYGAIGSDWQKGEITPIQIDAEPY